MEPALAPATTVDARMVRTRTALRAALLALIGRKPYDQITIRDIVAEAGVGYATFFRHHPTKGALLEDIVADEIGQLIGMSLPALREEGSRASSLSLCRHVNEHRALWSALLTGGAAGIVREEFVRVAMDVSPKLRWDGSWLPTDLGAVFGVSGTVEILAWWLRQPADFPVERVAEFLDRLVLIPSVGTHPTPRGEPAA
jgi:AcrR family transcriptional regulator